MQKLRFVNGNGVELDLTSGHYGITNWSGFSNADLTIQGQQVPFQDGEVFLDALYNPRELSVTLAINDNNNLALRYELKRELISVMNAKLGEGYLYYKNDFIEKRIKVVPQLPIFENKNSNDSGTLKASLTWIAPEVYWEDVKEIEIELQRNTVAEIENNGDIKSQVIINAVNQDQERVSIENIVTRKKIIVNSNKNLTINTNIGNKSIKENVTELVKSVFEISSAANKNGIFLYGGNWLYRSLDNITIESINSIELGNENYVFYSELFQKFIILAKRSIYLSDDGIVFDRTYYNQYMTNTFDEFYENDTWVITRDSGQNYLYKRKSLESVWSNVTFPHNTTNKKLITKKENVFIVREFYNNVSYIYETEDFEIFTLKLELEFEVKTLEYVENQNAIYFSDSSKVYKYNVNTYTETSSWDLVGVKYLYLSKNQGLFIANETSIYLQKGSNWQLISDNISINNVTDFKSDVFVSSSDGCFKIENYNLVFINSLVKKLTNAADLILWCDSSCSFDGELWQSKTKSYGGILSATTFKQILFASFGNYIKSSIDGKNFTQIKAENFYINKIFSTPNHLVRFHSGSGNRATIGRSTDGINWEDFVITNNNNTHIYSVCYSEDFDCFVAVGYGGIWYSEDMENWNRVYSWDVNFWIVVYDSDRKCFFTSAYASSSRQGLYFYSYNGVDWDYDYFQTSQNSKSIAVSDDGTVVFSHIDGISYMKKNDTYLRYIQIDPSVIVPPTYEGNESSVFYSKNLKLFFLKLYADQKIYCSKDGENWEFFAYMNYIFNSESTLHKIIYSWGFALFLKNENNLISDLTADSDMSFDLDLGNNYILPNFNGTLIYRQKYLGV